MPNMTPEELRKRVHDTILYNSPNAADKVTDAILQIFADLCGEVIGDWESNNYGGLDYSNKKDFRNALRSEQRTCLTKLTEKEIK